MADINEGAADAPDEALARVCRIVGEVRSLGRPALPDERLALDLGCTSFDMMVIVMRVEDEFGVRLDFGSLAGPVTARDLVAAVGFGGVRAPQMPCVKNHV